MAVSAALRVSSGGSGSAPRRKRRSAAAEGVGSEEGTIVRSDKMEDSLSVVELCEEWYGECEKGLEGDIDANGCDDVVNDKACIDSCLR